MKAYFWRHDDFGREGITRVYLLGFRDGNDLILDFHAGNLPDPDKGPEVITRQEEQISPRNREKIESGQAHHLWGHLPESGYVGHAEIGSDAGIMGLDQGCTEAADKKAERDRNLWDGLGWYMRRAGPAEPADI